jgi:tetratricopeptide (TPR) repeat protein
MADAAKINQWLEDLKQEDEMVRQVATEALWRHWYTQKGAYGAQMLVRSQTLLEAGKTTEAEGLLSELVRDQPDFAEAWNRRAVLYFLEKQYWKAISDCEQVLTLVPYHFGALHGLGLCHAALGNYLAAIQALRRALAVQPHATVNQRLILEYTTQLN